jgi:hypothetical protein
MAKKNDAAFDSFLADLKAINPAIEELVKDEKVSAKLREGVLARADYSSNMDTLRQERETFATEVQQARERIAGWQSWYGDVSQQVATINDKVKQYEDAYGPIETAGDARKAARQLGVSKEEMADLVESRMNQRDIAALKFADDLTDIKIDFKDRFKDRLDTEAVFKLAGERGVDLKTAYSAFINDRVEEQRTKDVEERIKQARVEAVTEYASKHNLPVAPSSSDMVHTLDAKDVPVTSRDRSTPPSLESCPCEMGGKEQ